MATIKFHGVGIKAMSACVPPDVVYNKDLGYLIPEEEIEKVSPSSKRTRFTPSIEA